MMAVVLPSLGAVAVGGTALSHACSELRSASAAWVGTVSLNVLQEDLARSVDSLSAVATPTPVAADDPALERVSRGDRVTGFRNRGSSVEVMVLLPPAPGDPPGTLRYAGGAIPPGPLAVARTAGSRLSLYVNGRRALATPDSLGADSLPRGTLLALSATPGGLALEGGEGGALVALDHPAGLPPSVAVMVAPARPSGPPHPRPILLLVGLVFAFVSVAGWIQLGAPAEGRAPRRRSFVLLAILPVATAVGFLVEGEQRFREEVVDASYRDLTRGLAVADARGDLPSPARVRSLTGFEATRVTAGGVEGSTLPGPWDALAALPPPPPSFTSSGAVATGAGPALYVARRLAEGGFLVATAPRPDARLDALRRTLLLVGAALGVWLLVAGWMLGGPEGVRSGR